jgi:hypothetical protein
MVDGQPGQADPIQAGGPEGSAGVPGPDGIVVSEQKPLAGNPPARNLLAGGDLVAMVDFGPNWNKIWNGPGIPCSTNTGTKWLHHLKELLCISLGCGCSSMKLW